MIEMTEMKMTNDIIPNVNIPLTSMLNGMTIISLLREGIYKLREEGWQVKEIRVSRHVLKVLGEQIKVWYPETKVLEKLFGYPIVEDNEDDYIGYQDSDILRLKEIVIVGRKVG